jgi:hypothetical protein
MRVYQGLLGDNGLGNVLPTIDAIISFGLKYLSFFSTVIAFEFPFEELHVL